jgi:hypothetical protein
VPQAGHQPVLHDRATVRTDPAPHDGRAPAGGGLDAPGVRLGEVPARRPAIGQAIHGEPLAYDVLAVAGPHRAVPVTLDHDDGQDTGARTHGGVGEASLPLRVWAARRHGEPGGGGVAGGGELRAGMHADRGVEVGVGGAEDTRHRGARR